MGRDAKKLGKTCAQAHEDPARAEQLPATYGNLINLPDNDGMTALHHAVFRGRGPEPNAATRGYDTTVQNLLAAPGFTAKLRRRDAKKLRKTYKHGQRRRDSE